MRMISIIILFFYSQLSFSFDCFDMAGRDYKIDPDLLRAISWRETNFNQNAINTKNHDGSIDIGIMQINSNNIDKFIIYGINQDNMKNDACLNIYTGAYILALSFKRWGVTWEAVGAYNAGFKKSDAQDKKRYLYAADIQQRFNAIKQSKGN